MRVYRRIAIALVSVVIGAVTSGCSRGSGADPRTLTLYSGQHVETTKRLVAAFERETGLRVKLRSGDEAKLANDIADAGSKRSADVFYAENTPALRLLERRHLLAPVPAPTLARVDTRWQSAAGDFVGVSARVAVLDYNRGRLKPAELPTSVTDLAAPEWKGKVGIAPGDTDFQAVVASVLRTRGEQPTIEWLAGLADNAGSYVYSDNDVLADAINRGQVSVGIVDQHSWFRERAKVGASRMKSALAFLRPQDSGYLLDISAAAVMRTSHAPAAAQRLLAFLVSRTGAEIIAKSNSYEYPLGSNVPAATALPEFNGLQPVPLSFNDLGDGTRVVTLLQHTGLL